jgi:ParB family transcriptional regulator, chromosome partitioning protein
MSLAENLARRQRSSLEMAKEILAMKERGHKIGDIAKKVDLDPHYVRGIVRLLENDEHKLLMAVERHQISLSMAIAIMQSNDEEMEKAMVEAFNRGELRGRALLKARALIARRRGGGKKLGNQAARAEKVSANTLIGVYRKETARQTVLMARARECEMRLRFVVSAMKKLLSDDGFINLLRAESMASMPKVLAEIVQDKEARHATAG